MRAVRALAAALLLLLLLLCQARALDNGLGAKPPMGWSSWNPYHAGQMGLDEKGIRAQADAMVSSGMAAVGYAYINVDDLWANRSRGADGAILPSHAFPSGMKALATYVHSKGLKFGLYSDVGTKTCGGQPGSFGHECADAATFADWGVDWLKEDHCSLPPNNDTDRFYHDSLLKMSQCLNATGRPIWFDLCAHGCYDIIDGVDQKHNASCWREWFSAAESIGNSWRTTTDIAVRGPRMWNSTLNNWYRNDAFATKLNLSQFAGPGHWNDPDSLIVGLPGLSLTQQRTHFTMWAMMNAPLIAGNRLDRMTDDTKQILLNRDVISLNQDDLVTQGRRVQLDGPKTLFADVYGDALERWEREVWAKPLAGGALALALVNHANSSAVVTASLSAVPTVFPKAVAAGARYKARELWTNATASVSAGGTLSHMVAGNGVAVFRLEPQSAAKERSAAQRMKSDETPLTCQPLATHPHVPIWHIIGNVSRNASLPGGLAFEHINDANGIFKWKGVYHVFHQCCQNHWDHVVSRDLIHWKRLPSPVRPDNDPLHWYDSSGSFDGSAAILPGKGPVILVDNIGPFTPPDSSLGATDNPGCQGLSWPVDPNDPELTHWRKDERNPISVDNLPCGSRPKNTAGAFPGSIFKTGDHFNFLSFGFRFTSTDPSLHTWHMVERQFLSNASKRENGGQWFFRMPSQVSGAAPPAGSATHIVSCGGGDRWCLGDYDAANESWRDYRGKNAQENLCKKFGRDYDVPGGDYNWANASRGDYKGCVSDGNCPCQADCNADPYCDAWTVIPQTTEDPRCCLKHFDGALRPVSGPHQKGFVVGVKDPSLCATGDVSMSDNGPDVGWLTAGFESGGIGLDTQPDRLLNIGWAVGMGFDPLHMKRGGDRSGGLTVPRELNYDPATGKVVANPVKELVNLRNATLASEENLRLTPGSRYNIPGTSGGAAASADIELVLALPATGALAFTTIVLSNAGYVSAMDPSSHGVIISVTVSAREADGTRTGTAQISSHGAAPCNPESPFCTPNSTAPETSDGRSAIAPFAVLANEENITVRVLVDRVIVEAFVQGGRAVFTKSFFPPVGSDSAIHVGANASAVATAIRVYSFGCGWVGTDDATIAPHPMKSDDDPESEASHRFGLFISAEWYSHDVAAIRSIWATASRLRHEAKDCPIYVEVCCDHTGPSPQQPIQPLCHWSNKSGSETRAALAGLRSAGDVHILRYIHTSKMHNTHCCEPAETVGNVTRRVEEELKASSDGIFFDDVMATSEYLPVYRAGWEASQRGGKRIVAWNEDCMKPHIPEHNPWCRDTPEEMMQMGDFHVLYEGLAAAFAPNASQLRWDPQRYRDKMTAYIYNASLAEWRGLVDRGREAGFTKFCVTGTKAEGPPGPDPGWPSFFDEMADYLAALNAGAVPGGVAAAGGYR